jgi:protein-S-isoprenylcysteine O-methyltransferase Ste14
MYYILLFISFACFLFHTIVHTLEHLNKLSEHKSTYAIIGITMFFGWFFYFYISFIDPLTMNFSFINYTGIPLLIIGFYLWIVSHAKIHKRMHTGEGKLTTDGVYKNLRHPMYLGEILMFLGAPILGGALLTLSLSPIFIIQVLIWRHFEEKELVQEFPEYAEYKKRTWF